MVDWSAGGSIAVTFTREQYDNLTPAQLRALNDDHWGRTSGYCPIDEILLPGRQCVREVSLEDEGDHDHDILFDEDLFD